MLRERSLCHRATLLLASDAARRLRCTLILLTRPCPQRAAALVAFLDIFLVSCLRPSYSPRKPLPAKSCTINCILIL